MDDVVRRWRQKAELQFWFEQNKRQGSGWHIAADADGCNELEEVFELALNAKYPSRFAFLLKPVPSKTAKCPKKLVLAYDGSHPPDYWVLTLRDDTATLEVGAERFTELRAVLELLRKQQFDFCYPIKGTDLGLWAWWPLT